MEAIDKIAKKHNLKVIYDAAHCFGVSLKDKSIFDFGDISTCSFHATKIFHTSEGGAIFCNQKSIQKKFLIITTLVMKITYHLMVLELMVR